MPRHNHEGGIGCQSAENSHGRSSRDAAKERDLSKRNSLLRADGDKQQLTRERKEKAIALHADGLTVNEIKTKMGVSRRTVKRYLPHAR